MGKNNKSKKAKKAAAAAASRGVVGPDYIQVLTGKLASKSISLILCGESHHDAIDITRAGGGKIKEGWEATDYIELAGEMAGKMGGIDDKDDDVHTSCIKCGICKRNTKSLPLGKAKEWGREIGTDEIDYIEPGHEMALLWVPSKENDVTKGRTYLVELFVDEEEISISTDEGNKKSTSHLPSDVVGLLNDMNRAVKEMKGVKSLSKVVHDIKAANDNGEKTQYTLLQWTDMDTEARQLNHRRILGEDISTLEYDELINERKKKRQKGDNTWTWDDWLVEVKTKLASSSSGAETAPAMHVVLESSIPPWEVELCKDSMPDFEFTQAADCIRCLPEDSDGSDIDAYDPASDGFGSYMDYIFRRLLVMERDTHGDVGSPGACSNFLHCVDCRDLGCEHACVDDSLHKEWMDLLEPEEKKKLLGSGPDAKHAHHKDGRCLPDWCHSPEESELDRLQASGELKMASSGDDDSEFDHDDSTDLITFPSLESFFGQNTDVLYYTPNVKVAYAPFLGKCVKSFDNWNSFFMELFLGGTVERALSMLDLTSDNRPYLHIRSPITKSWNAQSGEYEWGKRENEESDLTLPLFPIKSFLKSRGSIPGRTWSSQIFFSLEQSGCQEMIDVAKHASEWVLADIAKHCDNPKLSDDEIGGGEWFLAYLRQCHREIYDDIDHSDAAILLQKQSAAGETGKKHKIGDIMIPNCREGFRLIGKEMAHIESKPESSVCGNEAEVLAKILIDIYMSKLVDAATVAKIAQIISQEEKKNATIVCYMGSIHTRAVCDFFTQPKYGFKKKIFCGKQDWDENEGRIIHLPAELWNLGTLF